MCRDVVRTTTGGMGASGGAGRVVTGKLWLTSSPAAVRIASLKTYVVLGVKGMLLTERMETEWTRPPDLMIVKVSEPAFFPDNENPSVLPYDGFLGAPHRSSIAPAVMAPVMGGSATASRV